MLAEIQRRRSSAAAAKPQAPSSHIRSRQRCRPNRCLRKYGDHVALTDLNLVVRAGEVFGYIGPNGAGKTTTFRILAGLLDPSGGRALIDGDDVTGNRDYIKQAVGYLPDNFGVYPQLRVEEYLDFFAAAYRIPRRKRADRIDHCLQIANAIDYRQKLMGALSRWHEAARGYCQTLIHDPTVLILDEPAATIDSRARVQMRKLLRNLAKSGKAAPRSALPIKPLVPLLGQMAGVPAAPVSVPLLVVCGYGLLAMGLHWGSDAAGRQRAFAGIVALAVVLFTGLTGMTLLRTPNREIHGASISTIDLGIAGGGRQQELVCLAGKDDNDLSLKAVGDSVLRTLGSSDSGKVEIQQLPFAAPHADIRALQVRNIWYARSSIESKFSVGAIAHFGSDGLTLGVHNSLNQPLKSPLLVWGASWTLAEIAPGKSNSKPLHRNAHGDFQYAGLIRTNIESLRAGMISAELTPAPSLLPVRQERGPMLFAWVDVPSLIQPSRGCVMESLGLLRTPVAIAPTPVGSTVSIDGGFCSIIQGQGARLPYDQIREEWVPGNQPGQWLIGFATPSQIGRLRPSRVTLTADPSAPTQTISLFTGQCQNGSAAQNAQGRYIAIWNQPMGMRSVTFDTEPGDWDSNGIVWLWLRVESSSQALSPWFLRELEMSYVATVVGPPPNLESAAAP